MAVSATVLGFIANNPSFIVAVVVLVLFIYALSTFMSAPKPGKNPFEVDTTRPPEPLVTDNAARDKVLKQGFVSKKVPDDLDVIVIGSGIGGLSVAALLARTGKKVLVLEQHDQAGGCCHTYIEKGFEFDVGIHYIGEMRNNTMFKVYVDQLTDGQLLWVDLDEPFDTVVIGEPGKAKHYPLYSGKHKFRQSLVDNFPDDVEAIDKFLDMLKECRKNMLGHITTKMLPKGLSSVLAATGLINRMTDYYKYSQRTVQEVVEEITDNKDLQTVLSYSFGDYGALPTDSSFAMHATLLNHYIYGPSYPKGGASEIAFHIIPTIEKAGGKVLVRAPVTQILLDKEGKANGVRVHKSSGDVDVHAPMVISDAGFFNTFDRLLPKEVSQKAGFKSMVHKEIRNGVGAMSLFVGLNGSKEELGLKGSNCWAFTANDASKAALEFMGKSVEEAGQSDIPLLFISFPSAKDPTWDQRYPGKSTCAVITFANWEWFKDWENERVMKRGEEYDRLKNAIGDRMWEQTCLLYPQLKDKVEYFEVGTPVSNKHYIASPKGEIYGLDHNKTRFSAKTVSALRPTTAIPNLYLTGQDILSCGFAGAAFGGLLCASSILNRNLMTDALKLRQQLSKSK
ncbi:all-trans-retinol 13,14-reductase-like [Ptychodera flava]|uniref:all-trans-retinol 13,14-reductase-like n=1 Tax=Ptychodera flava TaxID=63121 RepID=UPI003969F891